MNQFNNGLYLPPDAFEGPFIVIVIFLAVLAILWLLLPFAVFGLKARLDKISRQLGQLVETDRYSDKLDRIGILLDPDETKAALNARHIQQRHAATQAEQDRYQLNLEQEKARERQRRETERAERKLARSKATGTCPSCQQPIEIQDLRPGLDHSCPICHFAFKVDTA